MISINNISELLKIGNDSLFPLDATYILSQDIIIEDNIDFTPIGNEDNPFRGVFDGSNHKITNLTINKSRTSFIGLFGYLEYTSKVINLILENAKIEGFYHVGSISGSNSGEILNCQSINCTIVGDTNVGGIVGSNYEGLVEECQYNGSVLGNYCVGGIAGLNMYGKVKLCNTVGSIIGSFRVGGCVGDSYESCVIGCYSKCLTSSSDNSGNLIGLSHSKIDLSF